MSTRSLLTALLIAGLALTGCASTPAGPRPTMPHPSWAPVVAPAAATAKPGTKSRPRATPKPGAMSDTEWRTAFCKTQDTVFALAFAVSHVADMGDTGSIDAFRRSIRTLDARTDRARKALLAVPARYARPLVTIELAYLRSVNLFSSRALGILRSRSTAGLPALKAVANQADRQWRQMVAVNRRLQNGEHRLICL